jgi:hypothetical protein
LRFERYWQSQYPNSAAILDILRYFYLDRWIRFRLLPEPKLYVESEAEYQVILQCHNAVLDHLANRGECMFFDIDRSQ